MVISNNFYRNLLNIKSKYIIEWTNQKVIDNKDNNVRETSTISSDMDSSVNYVFTLEMMF